MQTPDLIAVLASAVPGPHGDRPDCGVMGIATLAVVTALGGGVVRDLVLGVGRRPAGTDRVLPWTAPWWTLRALCTGAGEEHVRVVGQPESEYVRQDDG